MQALNRLNQTLSSATPVAAAFAVGTGATFLLVVPRLQNNAGESALVFLAQAAGVVLLVYGALMVASLVFRSAEFARRTGRRLRLQWPVRVLPDPNVADAEAQPLRGQIVPTGEVAVALIPGAPRSDLTASQALAGWANDRGRLRRALDIAITWLYRRENWEHLSHEGRYTEAAPGPIWGERKYEQLGVIGLAYEPPNQVGVEPDWMPREPGTQSRTLPVPPPRRHRPPLAQSIPDDAWAAQRAAFCERLGGLIGTGSTLEAELQAMPPHEAPSDFRILRSRVEAFRNACDVFAKTFYGPNVEFSAGHASLPPTWRQGYVTTVSSRVVWLNEQRDKYGCSGVSPLGPRQYGQS
jgi:hypothetical protein